MIKVFYHYVYGEGEIMKRFKIKEKEHFAGGIIRIVVDTKTGVNYIMTSGIGISGITPLLDNNGNIVIDKVK